MRRSPARVEGTSLLNALEKAEATEDRETLLSRGARTRKMMLDCGPVLLSAIDTNKTEGLDEAENWGRSSGEGWKT